MVRQKETRQLRDGSIDRVDFAPDAFYLGGDRITVADSPYTPLGTDELLQVDTTAGAIVIALPSSVGIEGRNHIIKDVGGNLSVLKSLTLTPDGTETIDLVPGSRVETNSFRILHIVAVTGGWNVIREG